VRGLLVFFFFSSRRRHTRYWRDWVQTCALPICEGESQKIPETSVKIKSFSL